MARAYRSCRAIPTALRVTTAVGSLLVREVFMSEPYARIAKVQSDLFAIREDLRDMLDDAKDARFIRLCAELGALAEEFILPEGSEQEVKPSVA